MTREKCEAVPRRGREGREIAVESTCRISDAERRRVRRRRLPRPGAGPWPGRSLQNRRERRGYPARGRDESDEAEQGDGVPADLEPRVTRLCPAQPQWRLRPRSQGARVDRRLSAA